MLLGLVNARSLCCGLSVLGSLKSHCWYLFLRMAMIWRKKDRSIVMAVQMDNLRGVLGIRRMGKVLNAGIRQLCGVTNGVDKKIDEGVLRWFGYVERMENGRVIP